MIASRELHHLRAVGEPPSNTYRGHDGLRSRTYEPKALERRGSGLADPFGEFVFQWRRCAEREAMTRRTSHGRDYS